MRQQTEHNTMDSYLPLRDVAFNVLREDILQGRLRPGERLMEIKLAERLGVSRTPIREAIRKLETEGFVMMRPRKGAKVADIKEKDLRDVLEIRGALEEVAVRKVGKHMEAALLEHLRETTADFRRMADEEDATRIADADALFHEILYEAAGNVRLVQIVKDLREQIYRYRVEYLKVRENRYTLAREHEQIVDQLEAGKYEEAGLTMRMHIERQKTGILRMITQEQTGRKESAIQ